MLLVKDIEVISLIQELKDEESANISGGQTTNTGTGTGTTTTPSTSTPTTSSSSGTGMNSLISPLLLRSVNSLDNQLLESSIS